MVYGIYGKRRHKAHASSAAANQCKQMNRSESGKFTRNNNDGGGEGSGVSGSGNNDNDDNDGDGVTMMNVGDSGGGDGGSGNNDNDDNDGDGVTMMNVGDGGGGDGGDGVDGDGGGTMMTMMIHKVNANARTTACYAFINLANLAEFKAIVLDIKDRLRKDNTGRGIISGNNDEVYGDRRSIEIWKWKGLEKLFGQLSGKSVILNVNGDDAGEQRCQALHTGGLKTGKQYWLNTTETKQSNH